MTIWFDMDGTIADLYGVENWLEYLIAEDTTPYDIAKPLVNLSYLARLLNQLQKEGYEVGIVSWLAREKSAFYDKLVTESKLGWLNQHLKSVNWDKILIVPYGTNKLNVTGGGILFDDEEQNRDNWLGEAYEPNMMIKVLKALLGRN